MGIFLQEVGHCIFSFGQWCFLAQWTEMYCNEFNCTTWESGSMCCVFLHTDSVSKSLCVVLLKTETLILLLFIATVDHKIWGKKARSDHIANNLENKTSSCHSTTELLLDMTRIFSPFPGVVSVFPQISRRVQTRPGEHVWQHIGSILTLCDAEFFFFVLFPWNQGFTEQQTG